MAIISALPVTLVNGTPNDANQVMTDFNWIVSQVNTNALDRNASVVNNANQNWGGFKITNLSAGSANTDAANVGQIATAVSAALNPSTFYPSGSGIAPATGLVVANTSGTAITASWRNLMLIDGTTIKFLPAGTASISTGATGAGGLDVGAISVGTQWYHLWVVYNPTTLTTSMVFSLQFPAGGTPTLPAGYTFYGYVGAFLWVSPAIQTFKQVGNVAVQAAVQVLAAGTQNALTAVSLSTAVPQNAVACSGWANGNYVGPAAFVSGDVSCDATGLGRITVFGGYIILGVAPSGSFVLPILTSQVLYYSMGVSANNTMTIKITGWTL